MVVVRGEASHPPVLVLGRGKAGGALMASFAAAGVDAAQLPGRHPLVAADLDDVQIVLLAVPDDAVVAVATALPTSKAVVAHLAGAHGRTHLPAHLRRGTFHLLASLAPGVPIERGAICATDGDDDAANERLTVLAKQLQLTPVRVADEHRRRYHAAAVIAGNLATALLQLGVEEMVEAGVPDDVARVGLARLLRSTAERAIASPLPTALTGPVARGDVTTIGAHLAILEGETREIYTQLTRVLIERVRSSSSSSSAPPPAWPAGVAARAAGGSQEPGS